MTDTLLTLDLRGRVLSLQPRERDRGPMQFIEILTAEEEERVRAAIRGCASEAGPGMTWRDAPDERG